MKTKEANIKLKIALIHGQSHKGSTYHTARMLADNLGGEITEFFLPKDFGEMCVGCTQCILKDEKRCPHYEKLEPITTAIDEADVLIFESPVYVYHVTSAMKALLEHYGWRWLLHRPEESMFKKQMVCIATAAGGGQKNTCQDMADSGFYWGVGKIYKYPIAVRAMKWADVPQKKKDKISEDMASLAEKIKSKDGKVNPSLKTKAFFSLMSMIVKKRPQSADYSYWKEKGWLDKNKPW